VKVDIPSAIDGSTMEEEVRMYMLEMGGRESSEDQKWRVKG
jgi:hypothetical protein